MSVLEQRQLGRTGLTVTPVCVGTSTIGLPFVYANEVTFEEGVAAARAALAEPFNFVDTSNGYGTSEAMIGEALRELGGLPPGVVLATKVDPKHPDPDFSGARVRRSVEESLERLGVDRLQLVHLHDPERVDFGDATGTGGAVEALVALREEGVIDHLGVAGFDIDLLGRYVGLGVFDVLLTHNRFTLIDQGASALMDDAVSRGVAVLNAAPYGGGMLAKGPDIVPRYCYAPASDDIVRRARAMKEICDAADVPLAAAALQFSMRDARITSTVVGMSRPERVAETVELATRDIPADVWQQLEPYLRTTAHA